MNKEKIFRSYREYEKEYFPRAYKERLEREKEEEEKEKRKWDKICK